MLGKLIKHDLVLVSKVMLPLHAALLALAMIGRAFVEVFNLATIPELLKISMFTLFIIFIIAVPIVTCIYFIRHFYVNLFTDEGYLMNTLPVKPWQHILTKTLTWIVWQFLDVLAVFAVILLIINSNEIGFDEIKAGIRLVLESGVEELGISIPYFIGMTMIDTIISVFVGIWSIYLAIAIGQLFRTHRVAAAFVAYIVIMIISTVISSGVMLILGYESFADRADFGKKIFDMAFYSSIILGMIQAVISYLGTNYIMKRKLNLE